MYFGIQQMCLMGVGHMALDNRKINALCLKNAI